jgi:DNA-binding PadR family transcriptional regulator
MSRSRRTCRRVQTVRNALTDLRDGGLVDVLSVGELEGHSTRAASYWRLTEKGRAELERLRRQ